METVMGKETVMGMETVVGMEETVMGKEEAVMEDDRWMREAVEEAVAALGKGEVPVGCVLVELGSGTVLARGHNQTNAGGDATLHCELVALRRLSGCRLVAGERRMAGVALYVTCEPCVMCAAALSLVGVGKVVFGCANARFGGVGSVYEIHQIM